MELKQISESIMRISDKAKIFKSKGQLTDNENIFIEALENRPII
jgi:hypothetical protein